MVFGFGVRLTNGAVSWARSIPHDVNTTNKNVSKCFMEKLYEFDI